MWAELQSGETTLLVGGDGRVQRRLRVVKVVVRPKEVPSAHLETSVQRFPDGRERVRNELLSEKVSRLRRHLALRRHPVTSAALPPSKPPRPQCPLTSPLPFSKITRPLLDGGRRGSI